jgi:fagellar hook-basal body proteins
MVRGIYIAATGLLSNTRSMDVAGNNLANLDTSGYKRDVLTQRSFGEHLTYLLSPDVGTSEIGTVTHGVTSDGAVTQYSQGNVEETGRNLDFAIGGEGFFTIALPNGTALSRDGRFSLNGDGYLTDTAGNMVQGVSGPIQFNSSDFTVDGNGNIYEDGAQAGALLITCPSDPAAVQKQGEGYYSYNGATVGFTGRIVQGSLESSNVDVTSEMAGMIADTRAFQTCAQVVRTMDEMAAKAVQLGSLK